MRNALLPFLTGVSALAGVAPAIAQDAPAEDLAFATAPVSDADLAEQRGGFTLPGGIAVSIAVQSDTRVNGVLLLRTIMTVNQGAPTVSVFGLATAAVSQATAAGSAAVASATEAADAAGEKASSSSVNVLNGVAISAGSTAAAIGQGQENLVKLDVAPNGAPVQAAGGTVQLHTGVGADKVSLSLPTLDVQHLVGQAYGTIAANRGNDVAIDTSTIINIDLQNVTPLNVGSALLRADTLGTNAAAALGGR